MKKSLLALAVLGAFAGAASAQTNVTIYGVVDAAMEWSDTDATSPNWRMTDANSSLNKNGSRIGFKGTEDLGGGLSAIFVLENGFNSDDGSLGQSSDKTRLFGRQAFVGLQSSFGAVKLGRQYTLMHLALDSIDPFGTGMAGSIARTGNFNNNGTRTDNTVNLSATAAGLTGQVQYAFGEQEGDTTAGRQATLGLGYVNGPINAQFVYHDAKGSATVANDTKTALLGASYNLGVAKVHAAFQTNKTELAATGAENSKERNYMLGVSAPVGVGEVRASFIRSDDRFGDTDEDQYAVGYVHNLSKRTNVYTSYARTNDRGASPVDGDLFNVGIQHKF